MKKYVIIFFTIIIFLFSFEISFWKTVATSKKEWYSLYKEQIKNFCKEYKDPPPPEKPVELIYILDESSYFVDLWERRDGNFIQEAINQYRENMDWIYNCATSLSTKRHLLLIKEELIKKSPELKSRIEPQIDELIERLEAKVEWLKWECKIETKKKDIQIKKAVLNQTIYEFCKYNFYLEYMYWQTENYLENYNNESVEAVNNRLFEKKRKILEENENSTITTTFAFIAYSDYEDNIGTHLLLELIKEDFAIVRDYLQKTLNPINQVVYKINNAMKY